MFKWLEVAEGEIGQHEIIGGENKRILEYFTATTYHAKEDEIPWCAAFINWCLKQSNIVGTNSAAAASFINWGVALTKPVEGCIVVIRQKFKGNDKSTGSSSGNHVALFQKIENNRIFLLGGNQSNSVKVSSFGLDNYEVLVYRLPENLEHL